MSKSNHRSTVATVVDRARPLDRQEAHEIQEFGIRTHEKQVWFLTEHLVDVPLVRAD